MGRTMVSATFALQTSSNSGIWGSSDMKSRQVNRSVCPPLPPSLGWKTQWPRPNWIGKRSWMRLRNNLRQPVAQADGSLDVERDADMWNKNML